MIRFWHRGNFSKTNKYLRDVKEAARVKILEEYGERGVSALSSATPVDTGLAATSWYYKVSRDDTGSRIEFFNSDIENGFPVAIMLQYGHGTGTGGWVEGRDYINPAIQPIFDELAEEAWKEVTRV